MTDYAELLATKSAELAELTRAFNDKRYDDARMLSAKMRNDFAELEGMALGYHYVISMSQLRNGL